ncbi:MAG: methyltransferase domain-containing protein [Actinomycetia bacterium]|nr:methyltransferase domain-containing protein [Actinomycetes bacterium]
MDMSDMKSLWDARYEAKGALWGAEPNQFLAEIAELLEPGTALDLGCGQGRNSFWLASRGFTVTGLDLSPVAIEQAAAVAEEFGVDVSFESVDLTTWDPAGRVWDLVVLTYLHLSGERRPVVHGAAKRAVAPGGRLVVIAHHLENFENGVGGPPIPELLFTEQQLADDFSDLEILRNEKVTRTTEEGDAIDLVFVAVRP